MKKNPHIAIIKVIDLTPSILSWKNKTARIETKGSTKEPIIFANSEDTSYTNPKIPMQHICHVTEQRARVII